MPAGGQRGVQRHGGGAAVLGTSERGAPAAFAALFEHLRRTTALARLAANDDASAAKSVAVLPFANMSTDADSEYFTDGMAEEVINALSKIQSLRVASRTSSFAFKGKNEDIGEIGKKLKVSTVLEGSVRKMGNRLRLTAQLVNVADGSNLWSEKYDREIEDIFAIQDDISASIRVLGRLQGEERRSGNECHSGLLVREW